MSIRTWFTIIIFAAIVGDVRAGLGRDPLPEEGPSMVTTEAAAPSVPAEPPTATREEPTPGKDSASDITENAAIPETQIDDIAADAPVMETRPLRHHRPLGLFTAFGNGDGNVRTSTLGADYHFNVGWTIGNHGLVSPYSEVLFSYWEGNEGHTGISSLFETGADMFLRYRYFSHPAADLKPYADLGFGFHYLSESSIENKEFGSHLQAGSTIGIGLTFPRDERYEIGIRIRHISNGGTDSTNWGANQILARVGFRF